MNTETRQLITIVRKEAREIVTNRILFVSGMFFAVWFAAMAALGVGQSAELTLAVQLNNSLFYTGALIGVFISYIYSGQTYLREKFSGIVETLLCAPVSLRTLWIGKALGVVGPSYVMALVAGGVMVAMANSRTEELIVPGAAVIVHMLVVVPVFIAAAVGLIGFAQLMLGMRENVVVNMGSITVLLAALAITRMIVDDKSLVSWSAVGWLFAGSLLLLGATAYLGRFLSKERIVTGIV
jgi:ABC-2 type transport system permease protein